MSCMMNFLQKEGVLFGFCFVLKNKACFFKHSLLLYAELQLNHECHEITSI